MIPEGFSKRENVDETHLVCQIGGVAAVGSTYGLADPQQPSNSPEGALDFHVAIPTYKDPNAF
jgi:hypothetical protein